MIDTLRLLNRKVDAMLGSDMDPRKQLMITWLLRYFDVVDRLEEHDTVIVSSVEGDVICNFEDYSICKIDDEILVPDLRFLKIYAVNNGFKPKPTKDDNINQFKFWLFETFNVGIGLCDEQQMELIANTESRSQVTFTFVEMIDSDHVDVQPNGKIFLPSKEDQFKKFVESLCLEKRSHF